MPLHATPTIATSVVLPDRNTMLFVRAAGSDSGWNLPTAAVAPGETIQQAACRAVLAATGVAVALTNLVGIYSTVLAAAPTSMRIVFSAYITPGRVRPGAQIAAVEWLTHAAIAACADSQLTDAPTLRRILVDLQRGMRFPLSVLVEPADG